jgi:hypothetical protein
LMKKDAKRASFLIYSMPRQIMKAKSKGRR